MLQNAEECLLSGVAKPFHVKDSINSLAVDHGTPFSDDVLLDVTLSIALSSIELNYSEIKPFLIWMGTPWKHLKDPCPYMTLNLNFIS